LEKSFKVGGVMSIPKYEEIMLPLLKFCKDEKEHSKQEAVLEMKKFFNVSDEEFSMLLPSGRQPIFDNRVAWAKSYMKQAGLVETTRRGYFKITQRGLDILEKNPQKIDKDFLMQFPEFVGFVNKSKKQIFEKQDISEEQSNQTPEEIFENSYQDLAQDLANDLLENINKCSPAFFERLVVELLVKMGYGGSRKDAGQAIGRTRDEGIDGIIKEDKLGLDIIYIQAKRWQNLVGRPEIQKFAGALQGKRAKKGIFITTSSFSQDALDFAKNIDSKIILIDGDELANLMIDHNVGVSVTATYELKKIDLDYFAEEL